MFNNLTNNLSQIVKSLLGATRLNEENIKSALEQVRVALLDADVPLSVVTDFLAEVQSKAVGQKVVSSLKPGEVLVKLVYDQLVALLGGGVVGLNLQARTPVVIMVAGLQGSGKTTSVAKLAHWLKTVQKKSVVLASVDIYRPAAIEQLQVLAGQVGVQFFSSSAQRSAVEIARAAVDYATKVLADVLIIDTAGRLHIDVEMMGELRSVYEVVRPTETLLVVDSMVGQDSLTMAKAFSESIPLSGVMLTKVDGDARGGAALVMRMVTQQPIKFVGTGEKLEALEQFYPERIASRILGMGDVVSLVEEVYQKVDQEHAQKLAKKLHKGKAFDLEDFRSQLQQIKKLGGVGGLISKLPKIGTLPAAAMNDGSLAKMEAIINSMTVKERLFPAFIKGSHKRRIALGSGTELQDVNKLLRQFEQMQKMVQRISGPKIQNMLKYLKGAA